MGVDEGVDSTLSRCPPRPSARSRGSIAERRRESLRLLDAYCAPLIREPREWCQRQRRTCQRLVARKFFYPVTCDFCFSHYVIAGFLVLTHFTLLMPG